jgi:hypothetical protein
LSVGRSSDTSSSYSSECRIDYSIFNGGHHNLVLYFFKRSGRGQPAACPLQRPEVVNVDLIGGKSLVFSFSLPQDLRHPSSGVDSSVVSQTVNLPRNTTKIGRNKVKVGLFSSVACPTNHQRQIAVTFTDEQGVGRTSNRLVTCT